MRKHRIDGATIAEWDAFHDTFAREFNFPAYYGRNMNAWNDCMSDLCGPEGIISLQIDNAGILKAKNPEIYEALIECSAFVNWRFTNEGGVPLIALAFYA
jgi:RNAse (barnase) inhibitor barstar